MKTILDQAKLDVVDRRETNLFDWKGQFTPDFIKYLLEVYSKPGMTVADPFVGSGTVLYESLSKDLNCIGYEINPSAYYMAKFYEYATLSIEERNAIIKEADNILGSKLSAYSEDDMVFVKNEDDDYRLSYHNLLKLATSISPLLTERTKSFLINIMFLCEKDKKLSLIASVNKNFEKVKAKILQLPYTKASVNAFMRDSRSMGSDYKESVDLIITSPPYINVFNYHQNYRGIIECFDFDILGVAKSEIGSNRKHRSNRLKTVVQYAIDMGNAVYNSALSLKEGGRMIYIVGVESTVLKTKFNNSKIIQDIVKLFPELSIEALNYRQFTNRYGQNIKEDIITINKNSAIKSCLSDDDYKHIGFNHLTAALGEASDSVKEGIRQIVSEEDKVEPSPILNIK